MLVFNSLYRMLYPIRVVIAIILTVLRGDGAQVLAQSAMFLGDR
jgi:hypothetical protein